MDMPVEKKIVFEIVAKNAQILQFLVILAKK